ncbi:hypothetical protein N431DRAFT_441047 [Stipitochalara longipes BDJ]|nr:hypothetical protein N431DRAFT_441047 [Stipitochalara longipes BDJ]
MKLFSVSILALAVVCTRAAHINHKLEDVSTPPDPCAIVSSSSKAFYAANPTSTASLRIPADIAYACQLSAPFDQNRSVALIDYIVPYIDFQSSLAYLKNPPSTYLMPAVDILGGLQEIRQNASVGAYSSQYTFDAAVADLVLQAHDGHFTYVPALLTTFSYYNEMPLVSISEDGLALPEVYIGTDVLAYLRNSTVVPSPIVSINGFNVTSYFLHEQGSNQKGAEMGQRDPDSEFNTMFYSLRALASNGLGNFATSGVVTSPAITYVLALQNGTVFNVSNFATPVISFNNISSGADLFAAVYSNQVEGLRQETDAGTIDLSVYPEPVLKHSKGLVAGYFLNTTGHTDTAVLALLTFSATSQAGQEYQSTVQNFLAACVLAGKTKLVIDLSGNPGGEPNLAVDVFKQLFPQKAPYHAARLRATDELDFLGSTLAKLPYNNATYADINYEAFESSSYTNFLSWAQLFGPYSIYGDNFTSLLQANFSDPVQTLDQDDFVVTGYLNRSTGFTQPFAAENIVLLYDSYCASACAHFSEMMQVQTTVPSIVFGGRPQYGPMQAVGGVRGYYKIAFADIESLSGKSQEIAKQYNISIPQTLALPSTAKIPLKATLATFNSGNIIRSDDETNTPTQFLYDAADCRLFWTAENLLDVTTIWEKAADYRWGNGKCVQSSSLRKYKDCSF